MLLPSEIHLRKATLKRKNPGIAQIFLAEARYSLKARYLPRLIECLELLSEKEIWWRPNAASNSAGNLVLHLAGNARQWIVSGLGGAPYTRDRDSEFAERGPIPRRALIALLRNAVGEACRVLGRMPESSLARIYSIQRFRVTGLVAVSHVMEHFAYHTGQIIFVTKSKRGRDLRFTKLPGKKSKMGAAKAP
jgi:uncharacterized damage-inducible protein DinB